MALDRRAARDQRHRRNLDRVRGGTDHDQLAARRQTADHSAHGLRVGDSGEGRRCAAELLELLRRVLRGAVDVVVGAKLARQRLLVGPARDRHRS